MAPGSVLILVDFRQSLPCVVTDRLEKAESGVARAGVGHDEGLIHQLEENVGYIESIEIVVGDNRLDRRRVEVTGEHRKTPQDDAFALLEEIVGPIDGTSEGLVSTHRRASSSA